jgi:hypothetical protein
MRLKCRLLLDSFQSRAQKPEDMLAKDFDGTHPALDKRKLKRLRVTVEKFNPWTVHLSWKRTTESEYSKADRQAMERCAMALLETGARFVEECRAAGTGLTAAGEKYHAAFLALYSFLCSTPRVEEGRGGSRTPLRIQDLK